MVNRKQIGNFIIKKRSFLPNTITMLNMTMGFFAIIFAGRGDEVSLAFAGVLVFIGTLFDASDGAVARAMKVSSPVGIQLDSLADGIAYGIAPAIIAYQAFLCKLPEIGYGFNIGIIIAPVYPICAIYRLARFNITPQGHNGFFGLPSPAAGIIIATIPALPFSRILFTEKIDFDLSIQAFVLLYISIGLLMVSRVDYGKFTTRILKKGKFTVILTIALVLLLLILFQMWSVFIITFLYVFAGLINTAFKPIRKRSSQRKARAKNTG